MCLRTNRPPCQGPCHPIRGGGARFKRALGISCAHTIAPALLVSQPRAAAGRLSAQVTPRGGARGLAGLAWAVENRARAAPRVYVYVCVVCGVLSILGSPVKKAPLHATARRVSFGEDEEILRGGPCDKNRPC